VAHDFLVKQIEAPDIVHRARMGVGKAQFLADLVLATGDVLLI
jgi:hypothetical protein